MSQPLLQVVTRWCVPLPFGPVEVSCVGETLVGLRFLMPGEAGVQALLSLDTYKDHPVTKALDAYAQGNGLPLTQLVYQWPVAATPFQRKVWEALSEVPFGETRSYGWLATQVGETPKTHSRAVGGALAHNPLPLRFPCHRIIQTGGQLGGFMGEKAPSSLTVEIKQQLLTHEQSTGS